MLNQLFAILFFLIIAIPGLADAYSISNDYLSSVGGYWQGASYIIKSGNMRPYAHPSLPDLVITSLSGPKIAAPGQSINLLNIVENRGSFIADASSVEFYLSRRPVLEIDADIFLGRRDIVGLDASASSKATTSVIIPKSTPSGTYYIGGIVDPDFFVNEENENNNTRIADTRIKVADPTPPPVAKFEGAPLTGTSPLAVNFSNQSTGSISSWAWDFGDKSTSSKKNPSHIYNSSGKYTVKLTASGPDGSDTETKVDYITVTTAAPKADFNASPTSGKAPLAVHFTDNSKGAITSWKWDFGDRGSSTNHDPSHTYNAAGSYTVKLVVTGPGGNDTKIKEGYITVSSSDDFKASGRVSMLNGHPVQGKTIIFSASVKNVTIPAPVQTDQDGRWSQEGFQKGVIYDIQPEHDGYSYFPSSRRYKAVNSKSDLDFQIVSFTVSGKTLTPRLIPIPGVIISFSVVSGKGSTPSAVRTSDDGNWSQMRFDPSTIYKASPSKRKYRFHPIAIQFGGPTKSCDFEGSLQNK